ncbi:MAG: GNAT family N-acetyltransferase [Haloferacaceae archaeon]
MEIREATRDDVTAIRAVARESLTESYGHALSEAVIDEAVERWYDAEKLAEELDREDVVFLLGVVDGDPVAFAQSSVVRGRETVGDVDWIHVRPGRRGEGYGAELLAAVEATLRERDVDRIEARVLAENERGARFYEAHDFERTGEATVEIGGERFAELRYGKSLASEEGAVVVEARRGPDGERLYVDFEERERASLAPFFAAYADRDHEERYGWFCSNCEGFDTAMDAMGHVECNGCGNRRRPSRWDAAYL